MWSTCVFLCQSHAAFITTALLHNLKSDTFSIVLCPGLLWPSNNFMFIKELNFFQYLGKMILTFWWGFNWVFTEPLVKWPFFFLQYWFFQPTSIRDFYIFQHLLQFLSWGTKRSFLPVVCFEIFIIEFITSLVGFILIFYIYHHKSCCKWDFPFLFFFSVFATHI